MEILKNEFAIATKLIFIAVQLLIIALMLMPAFMSSIDLWWLDNLANFQLQWTILAIVSVLLNVFFFRILTIPLALIFLSIFLYNFTAFFSAGVSSNQSGAQFKIAQLNISYGNPNVDSIILGLIDSDYDAVLIQEIADREVDKFAQLLVGFPYSIGSNSLGTFSSRLALFSRWPMLNRRIHDLGYVEGKVIEVTLAPADGNIPVRILALHPGAPRSPDLWGLRNATLEFIAAEVSSSTLPHQIVIGDVNVSPWSPFFRNLVRNSGLQDGVSGHGYIPSWSAFTTNNLMRLLSSTYIDHCLVSHSIAVRGKDLRFIEGSDHLLIENSLELNQVPD